MLKDKHLRISLNLLLVATFLSQMITGVVGITVPIYANLLGASPFLVGVIGASGGLVYSFMPLVSGILSDKIKKKIFISLSMISYGISCFLYTVAEDPFMFVPIRALEWVSIAAFWPVVEALLADMSLENLEEILGKFNVSWGSAMIIGPTVGGLLISGYNIKAPFLVSLAISVPLGVLSFIILDGSSGRRESNIPEDRAVGRNLDGQYSIVIGLSSIFLFSSLNGIVASLFPAYATDLRIPAYEIGLVMFANGATRTMAFYLANKIEAKISKTGMFLAGSSILAIASALTINSYTTSAFLFSFVFFGLGAGISYAASVSFILRRWGSSTGFAAGIFESLIGFGYFVGPLIGGAISEYALNAPYIYGFMLSLTAFSIQLSLSRRSSSFSKGGKKTP